MQRLPKVTTLGDAVGFYRISIRCTGCKRVTVIDPQVLAIRTGYGVTLTDLMTKLKCSGCGKKLAIVTTISIGADEDRQ
jgi:hypothetical protein